MLWITSFGKVERATIPMTSKRLPDGTSSFNSTAGNTQNMFLFNGPCCWPGGDENHLENKLEPRVGSFPEKC